MESDVWVSRGSVIHLPIISPRRGLELVALASLVRGCINKSKEGLLSGEYLIPPSDT
jgi:hypothetical protein